jgi:hypothetical protein
MANDLLPPQDDIDVGEAAPPAALADKLRHKDADRPQSRELAAEREGTRGSMMLCRLHDQPSQRL